MQKINLIHDSWSIDLILNQFYDKSSVFVFKPDKALYNYTYVVKTTVWCYGCCLPYFDKVITNIILCFSYY